MSIDTRLVALMLLATASLLIALLTRGAAPSSYKATVPPDAVEVKLSSSSITSQFAGGLTLVENTSGLSGTTGNAADISSLMQKTVRYIDTPIMGWGMPDPWPAPAQAMPNNWSSLDKRLQYIIHMGAVPVITLNEAPWWMKGQLQADGTTRLLNASQEWSDTAFGARILDNKMDVWLQLIQQIAARYMVAPYNVRYFQVWNELKGYYNPMTNDYDYTTSAGHPNSPSATHGYTYMYNRAYNTLMQVATTLSIPTSGIKVGGPYAVMDTWSSLQQSNPSHFIKAYGMYDMRPLTVLQYWLQHKAGAGFITLDGSNSNRDNGDLTDPFTSSEKFADVTSWIRSLDTTLYPGAKTLPIWWAEWYATPSTHTTNDAYNNAVKTFAMIEFIKAGGAVPFLWGGLGEGTSSTGLWTSMGQPLPWGDAYEALSTCFGSGTKIYATSVSAPNSAEALASATKVLLVNKTASTLYVSVNGKFMLLHPYQVSLTNLTP